MGRGTVAKTAPDAPYMNQALGRLGLISTTSPSVAGVMRSSAIGFADSEKGREVRDRTAADPHIDVCRILNP
jgi:hypothetical protein